mgnify:FL=1
MKNFKFIRSELDHLSFELICKKYTFKLRSNVYKTFEKDLFYYSTLMKYMGV